MFPRTRLLLLTLASFGCGDHDELPLAPEEAAPEVGRPGGERSEVDVDPPVEPVEVTPIDTPDNPPVLLAVRRAALRSVNTVSAPPFAVTPAGVPQCADGQAVTGELDKHSPTWFGGGFGMFFDAYVVTALRSGMTSIYSAVLSSHDTYEHGYGYPFTVQALESSGVSLSMDLVKGSPLPDNALDDGKARIDLSVEAGRQYIVVYKNIFGDNYDLNYLRYQLSLCGADVRVEGKLWVSEDKSDLIPAAEPTGPLSVETPESVMAGLASKIAVN